MHTTAQISSIHARTILSRKGWLSPKEKDFVRSIAEQSRRPSFAGLSVKQESWLSAIERKLEKEHHYAMSIIGRRQRAYAGVCMSW